MMQKKKVEKKPAVDGGDTRNMLLEQIRNPGVKLKSSKERKAEEASAEKRGGAPRSTADLFGDLLSALKIRRQGMQGNNEAKSKSEENAPAQSDILPKREDADWEDS